VQRQAAQLAPPGGAAKRAEHKRFESLPSQQLPISTVVNLSCPLCMRHSTWLSQDASSIHDRFPSQHGQTAINSAYSADTGYDVAVRQLREELQLLQEPGSYVGEVIKVMGKKKVLCKVCLNDGLCISSVVRCIPAHACRSAEEDRARFSRGQV